jgi:homoserine O-succinyltransferase/O-acetyltransferase
MPLNIPDKLPAIKELRKENIFVLQEKKALKQDIRPLQIALLNLMPIKTETELHLLRLLSNSPLQVEVTLLHTDSHTPRHTPKEHLDAFYNTFSIIEKKNFDGMIITGAPVEKMRFEDVDYWEEMKEIMEWSKEHVTSTIYICWAAQAGLYHHYGIPKRIVDDKIFGVFKHKVIDPNIPLVRGFDDEFLAPHSRYSTTNREDINEKKELQILAESEDAGVYIAADKTGKMIFVSGHGEYDPLALKREYERDLKKEKKTVIPCNYFPDNDPSKDPIIRWTSHANLLFSNWLNYYVYQMTSFRWAIK